MCLLCLSILALKVCSLYVRLCYVRALGYVPMICVCADALCMYRMCAMCVNINLMYVCNVCSV